MDNSIQNTGFFISLWNYFIACVMQDAPNKEEKTKYFLLSINETRELKILENVTDSTSAMNKLCNLLYNESIFVMFIRANKIRKTKDYAETQVYHAKEIAL